MVRRSKRLLILSENSRPSNDSDTNMLIANLNHGADRTPPREAGGEGGEVTVRPPRRSQTHAREFEFLEEERQSEVLQKLENNCPGVSVTGVFRDYEDYGLPGYASCPKRVKHTTRVLVRALHRNTRVTEFVLNLRALEFILPRRKKTAASEDSPSSSGEATEPNEELLPALLYFLKHNPSLRTLNIRIPPGTKASPHLAGLFGKRRLPNPSLEEVTLWIPREQRPQRLRMRTLHRGGVVFGSGATFAVEASRRRQEPTGARLPHPMAASAPRHGNASAARHAQLSLFASARRRRPVRFRQSYAESGGARFYNLSGIARYVSQLPRLRYLRIQASSLDTAQWTTLVAGLAASPSLEHLELRRVELDAGIRMTDFVPLARRIHRLDVHGTTLDASELLARTQQGNGSRKTEPASSLPETTSHHRQLTKLSWSSAKLVNVRRLMSILSLPSASLQLLELSHLNLSGEKCLLLAQMLQRNTSILHLNVSRASLDSLDASRLAMGLQSNQTLRKLILMDNHIWKTESFPATRTENQAYPVLPPPEPFDQTPANDPVATPSSPHGVNRAFHAFRELLEANTPLEYLDLSDNGLEAIDQDERYAILLNGFYGGKNTNLKTLKLSNQSNLFLDTLQTIFGGSPRMLHPGVSKALGNALIHSRIQELVFNYNRLDDANFAEHVAPAFAHNKTLRVLGLKRVGLGNASVIAMSRALARHPTLESLDVSYNINITDEGYEELSKTVANLPKLHTLWFHTMARHQEEQAKAQHRYTLIIGKALRYNHSLQTISHPEVLDEISHFYYMLNNYDRKHLCSREKEIPLALWPRLLENLPVKALAFYVRRNIGLMASVSLQEREITTEHLPPSGHKRISEELCGLQRGRKRSKKQRSVR